MADQSMLDYISRATQAGMGKLEIINQLQSVGWAQADIDAAFVGSNAIVAPPPVPAAPQQQITQPSKLNTLSGWILTLIVIRLLFIPVQYFLVPLLTSPDGVFNFSQAVSVGLLGSLLPMAWLIPLFMIPKRQRNGYVLAIFFAIVLIYLNFFGLFSLVISPWLSFVSFVYVTTGIAIIVLSSMSLKLLPTQRESAHLEQSISKSGTATFAVVLAIVFGLIVIAPSLMGMGGMNGLFGQSLNDPTPSLVAVILGALFGWLCAYSMARSLQKRQQSFALTKGVFYGALCGAAAQLPLYGFNGIQIIAMPIGAMIGAVVGLVLAFIIYFIMERTLI